MPHDTVLNREHHCDWVVWGRCDQVIFRDAGTRIYQTLRKVHQCTSESVFVALSLIVDPSVTADAITGESSPELGRQRLNMLRFRRELA